MSKVYFVTIGQCNLDGWLGFFSSQEKAEAAIAKDKREADFKHEYYHIEAFEIDKFEKYMMW